MTLTPTQLFILQVMHYERKSLQNARGHGWVLELNGEVKSSDAEALLAAGMIQLEHDPPSTYAAQEYRISPAGAAAVTEAHEARSRAYWQGVLDRAREPGVSDDAHRRAAGEMVDRAMQDGRSVHLIVSEYKQLARQYA